MRILFTKKYCARNMSALSFVHERRNEAPRTKDETMKVKKQISSVTMNGTQIGTIIGDTSAGSTPWGLSHTVNSIIKLCRDQGLWMIGSEFVVTFPSGKKWEWEPRR